MSTLKHIAVLMGGWSSERPVSLASGKPCAEALRSLGYKVTEVDVDRNLSATLSALKPDVAFNALHGPFGEDGTVQGVLEYLEIPYTHSGVLASALALDKEKTKQVLSAYGVPVAEAVLTSRFNAAKKHLMAPPYVVKPVNEGSSFGVLIVKDDQAHPPQELFSDSWPYGDDVMVERFIDGRELTCAIIDGKASEVTDIIAEAGYFYDYESKYAECGSKHIIPADIPANIYQKVQELSLIAHDALGCKGVTRSDFRYDDTATGNGELIFLEINTQPGMTPTSLVPDVAAHQGIKFASLLNWMVEDASCAR